MSPLSFKQLVLSARLRRREAWRVFFGVTVATSVMMATLPAFAAPPTGLPGPADASRIDKRETIQIPEATVSPPTGPMDVLPTVQAPESSKHVMMVLKAVRITGMTVYSTNDIKDIYAPYLDREITLDVVWIMAQQLTQRYRDAGYFLTQVVVPQQDVDDGVVLLRVIEGYVGEIKFDDPLAENRIVRSWLDRLRSFRPLKADQIESVLLQLNDIPGVDLHAVLEPIQPVTESTEGAVRLVLERKPVAKFGGSVSVDNNGSRFLGPYEIQTQAQAVLLPGERTTLTGLTTMPWDDMKYGNIKQELSLFERASLELYGSYTRAAPGYTLANEDIRSHSTSLGLAFDYNLIRQRQETLNARMALESQDTESNILGTPLTRDYIRALRLALSYQLADTWDGQNSFSTTLSQGLPILGASPAGQLNISRAAAHPDFTKADFELSRLQTIFDNWGLQTALSAQVASGPLYSSEQFGYGGQAFGRAYDNSEITGDQGIEGSAELRYSGIAVRYHLQPVPYGFYDMGAVWNLGSDTTTPYATGSSAGAGFRLLTDFGVSANTGLAFPLTKRIDNPLTGNGRNPRYYFSFAYGF